MIDTVHKQRARLFQARLLVSPIPFATCLFLIELAAALALSGGQFSYVLDDPYIHLAVSEELARGGYGINSDELASPSSSILWPLILTPFARLSFHPYLPLILNYGFVLASALTARRLFETELRSEHRPAVRDGLTTLLLFLGSFVFLAFMGLEHVLQSWLGLLILLGVILAKREGRTRWWLWAALAGAPLVRFDSLSLTVPFAFLLWRMGYGRQVLTIVAVLSVAFLLYAGVMRMLDLPILPSSILVKAAIAHADLSIGSTATGLVRNFFSAHILLRLSGFLLLVALLVGRHRGPALALAAACMLHFIFGLSGYAFGRYEAYLLVAAISLFALAGAPALASLAERRGLLVAMFAAALIATPLWPMAVRNHAYLPLAAANIVAQQHEMHRFATEFVQGPVAVNDLGRVSYRNEHYVLDLWGLGSEEARRRRLSGEPGWAKGLLSQHDVQLAMIYDDWLANEVPADWMPIGRLALTRKFDTGLLPEVAFYARPDRAAELTEAARRFAAGLPPGASFRFAE
ncbi:MAG TPA: hypothetical protein VED46_07065 [Alphaproteobacteria bacterium]|nr:hypothetical protein [Alphaproteobacteria bacterium]